MQSFAELMAADTSRIEVDAQGLVAGVTPRFTEHFGWGADLVGKPLTTIIPPALHDAHHMGFSRHLAGGPPVVAGQELELEIVTATGETVLALHYILPNPEGGRPRLAARIEPR